MKNADPRFWPDTTAELSLKQSIQRNYTESINVLQTQWQQADLDQRFVIGDQDIWGIMFPGPTTFKRKMFNFNLINSTIQMISGYQRRNRKSTVCIPVHTPMQRTADQFTKCLYHVHKDGAYQIYSDAFEQGALTQGIGLVSIYKDMTNDPISGDIKLRYIDFKSVLIDPFFRRHDLSDCRFIHTRQFFEKNEAAQLYSQFADEILSLPSGSYRDDKFYYMPEVYQIQFPNLVTFDEYWYLSTREAEYLVDTETNECQEFTGDEEDLRIILGSFKKRLKVIKKSRPTVRRTILVNDRVLVDEPNPYGIDRYPFAASLGYFTPDTPYYAYKFRGVVRDMRDAQYLFNRRKVADLDILESQQQGLKVKKGALVTPEDGLNSGNGRMLIIDDEHSMDDVQQMQIIPPAPTMIQMEEMLSQVMTRISGVNETMLGADINDKAGIISMLRNSAGITTLTRLFDQFDEFQRLCGDIILEMIQKNWTYGKIRQIIGEEPTAEFDNKAFFKYGCKVIQGALTETQQQLNLQQLLYFRETTGIPIPAKVSIQASTLQNKDDLIEAIEKEEKAQQEQQQKIQQLQMQQIAVETQTKLGYAHSQEALATERLAKVQLDKALNMERIQRAEEDRTGAVLNLVKAVKEIQGIDLTHLQQTLDLVQRLKGEEGAEAEDKAKQPLKEGTYA